MLTYRVLREDEIAHSNNECEADFGLIAKNPSADVPLADFHHSGTKGMFQSLSQFIASTKNFATALEYARIGGRLRIAVIDASVTAFLDCSTEMLAKNYYFCKDFKWNGSAYKKKPKYFDIASYFAQASSEVDFVGSVPAEAVLGIFNYSDCVKAVNKTWDPEKPQRKNYDAAVEHLLEKEKIKC